MQVFSSGFQEKPVDFHQEKTKMSTLHVAAGLWQPHSSSHPMASSREPENPGGKRDLQEPPLAASRQWALSCSESYWILPVLGSSPPREAAGLIGWQCSSLKVYVRMSGHSSSCWSLSEHTQNEWLVCKLHDSRHLPLLTVVSLAASMVPSTE